MTMPRPARLQAIILDALEPAKQAHASEELSYLGGGIRLVGNHPDRPGEVFSKGAYVKLGAGIYDMRATLPYVAQRWSKDTELTHVNRRGFYTVDFGFGNQFRKAVKRLVAKGKLYEAAINPDNKQLRFVCLDPALRKLPKLCVSCGEKIRGEVGRIGLQREQAGAVKDDNNGGFYWLFHKDSAACFEQACSKRDQLES
jgi:hypothetical protein